MVVDDVVSGNRLDELGAAALVLFELLVAVVPPGFPGGGEDIGGVGLLVLRLAGEAGHVALLVGLVQAFQAPVFESGVSGRRHRMCQCGISRQASWPPARAEGHWSAPNGTIDGFVTGCPIPGPP